MGTSNFYTKNATKTFVVCASYQQPVLDDDGNETEEMETHYPESYEIDEEIQYFKDTLKVKAKEAKLSYYDNKNESDNCRNFEGTKMCTVYTSKSFAGCEVEINIECIIRSGYYEAANLDYDIVIICGGNETDEITDDDMYYGMDNRNTGMAKIQAKNARAYVEKMTDELTAFIEKVYTEISCCYSPFFQWRNMV
jgi:hypothetical protein